MSEAIRLSTTNKTLSLNVPLTSSKSESNRAILINHLAGGRAQLNNLSTARDTQTMIKLLKSNEQTLDVLDAGTVMRFLTAFLAIGDQHRIITGTPRMCERPIKVLVDALNQLGANISYLDHEGFPPLAFQAFSKQKTAHLSIQGNISSQYISALLMIAPILENGLTIELTGEIYSRPYIEMTLNLMDHFGVKSQFEGNQISVQHQSYQNNEYTIESDWSGASYWYSLAALSDHSTIGLLGLRSKSNQGDHAIASIMKSMGVESKFSANKVELIRGITEEKLSLDFKSCPDLAQTVMACAAALGITLEMTGLESLAIKETNRTAAMATELGKIGTKLFESHPGTWQLHPDKNFISNSPITFETYDDHRMAMALAPLCLKYDLIIKNPRVVEKSYPEFWDHLKQAGISIKHN